MYGAKRIPLQQHSLRDFPMIKFHFEHECRFLFIANIHSIMSNSLPRYSVMRMGEAGAFFSLRMTIKAIENKGKTDLDLGLVRRLQLTLLDLTKLSFRLLQ